MFSLYRERAYQKMDESEHFYLVFQPIVRICGQNAVGFEEFEVLLRSMKTQKFPADIFHEILENENKYNKYMNWFKLELEQQIKEHPNIKFSINIDIDQFRFGLTFQFLEYFSQYHHQLIIEITEHTPKNDPELLLALESILKKIKACNYKIAIDDYTAGINTFASYKSNRQYYDRVKIMFLGYKSVLYILGFVIYVNIMRFFFSKRIEIVVERIDSLRKSRITKSLSVCLQQGYYFGTEKNIIRGKTDRDCYEG